MPQNSNNRGIEPAHGSYAGDFPLMGGGFGGSYRRSGSTSSGSTTIHAIPEAKFTDVTPGMKELPTEVDSPYSTRISSYFNARAQSEVFDLNLNVKYRAKLLSYGGKEADFFQLEGNNIIKDLYTSTTLRNQALKVKNLAEQEVSSYNESDIKDMDMDARLWRMSGDPYTIEDVSGSSNAINAMAVSNPGLLANLYGIGHKEIIADNKTFNQLSAEERVSAVKLREPTQLTKAARLMLQDYFPLGTKFDDIEAPDYQSLLDGIQNQIDDLGTKTVDANGNPVEYEPNGKQIRAALDVYFSSGVFENEKTHKAYNVLLHREADAQQASLSIMPQDALDKLSADYKTFTTFYGKFKSLPGHEDATYFDLFTEANKADVSEAISSMPVGTDFGFLESTEKAIPVMLYGDMKDHTLTAAQRRWMFSKTLKEKFENMYISEHTSEAKNDPVARRELVAAAAAQGNYDPLIHAFDFVAFSSDNVSLTEGQANSLATNARGKWGEDKNNWGSAYSWIKGNPNVHVSPDFFSGVDNGGIDGIRDGILIDAGKERYFKQFFSYLKSNPDALKDDGISVNPKFLRIYKDYSVSGLDDPAAEMTGKGISFDLGDEFESGKISYSKLITTKGFHEWASSLSDSEQSDLWNVDTYFSAATGNKDYSNEGDPLYQRIAAINAETKATDPKAYPAQARSLDPYWSTSTSPYTNKDIPTGGMSWYNTTTKQVMPSPFRTASIKEDIVIDGLPNVPEGKMVIRAWIPVNKSQMKQIPLNVIGEENSTYWDDYGSDEYKYSYQIKQGFVSDILTQEAKNNVVISTKEKDLSGLYIVPVLYVVPQSAWYSTTPDAKVSVKEFYKQSGELNTYTP